MNDVMPRDCPELEEEAGVAEPVEEDEADVFDLAHEPFDAGEDDEF